MTIKETYDIFFHFMDESRDEHITNAAFSRFINTAMLAVMKNHFHPEHGAGKRSPKETPTLGYAQTQFEDEDFKELIEPVEVTTDSEGKILYSLIEENFPEDVVRGEDGIYEVRKCKFFHAASAMRWNGDRFVKSTWQRHNNHSSDAENPFRVPTNRFPKHRYFKTYLEFLPKETRNLKLAVVRIPKHVWLDETNETLNVDPEMSDSVMIDVIFRSLSFAGIHIREAQISEYMNREELKL